MENYSKFEDFFEFIQKIKSEIEEQKKRGLNDYNPLLEVLKASDEVRLHSRMLGSLLNSNGKHYQNDLFLKKFIKILDIEFDSQNAILKKEYENIDLYITDGNKHIIIENKIYADDQKCQISRYVKTIKELSGTSDENILIVYITNQNKNCPNGHMCEEGYIKPNEKCKNKTTNFKIKYKRLSYQKDILNWLKECQKEIRNITNLNMAFEFYIQVIQKITKKFKGAVMDIYEKIIENPEYAYLALEINQTKIKIELIKQLFNKIEEDFTFYGYLDNFKINNELNLDEYLDNFFNKQKNRAKNFGKIYNLNNQEYKLLLFIGIDWIHYGIIKIKDNQWENLENNETIKPLLKKYQWEYRGNWKFKWYSKRIINLHRLNSNEVKKLSIEQNLFIEQIKKETNEILKGLIK